MRILVDCCNYFLDNHNHGDRAMYKVIVERLLRQWPRAEISWITLDPPLIQRTIPTVTPLLLKQRHDWQLYTSMQRPAAPGLRGLISNLQDGSSFPDRAQRMLIRATPDARILVTAVRRADLVLALGGGAFSDHFVEHARGLLDTLGIALIFDKPAALLSVGFEPITNPLLIEKCKRILPRLSLIACREPDFGPEMLLHMGIPNERVYVAGDEAVDLAYRHRPKTMGQAIGVNLRRSAYSGVEGQAIGAIRELLQKAAGEFRAPLLGCPISMFGPSDIENIQQLIDGFAGAADSGNNLEEPEQVIRQIGKCRVVVTGSYHAAVFALSQGIPTVALARTLHYRTKLAGLAAQFRGGCFIVDLENVGFATAFRQALDDAWRQAPELKEPLLQAARAQSEAARKVYDDLLALTLRTKHMPVVNGTETAGRDTLAVARSKPLS
jgi:polysaccharide pyruvyl transferase WcaK-like protein